MFTMHDSNSMVSSPTEDKKGPGAWHEFKVVLRIATPDIQDSMSFADVGRWRGWLLVEMGVEGDVHFREA